MVPNVYSSTFRVEQEFHQKVTYRSVTLQQPCITLGQRLLCRQDVRQVVGSRRGPTFITLPTIPRLLSFYKGEELWVIDGPSVPRGTSPDSGTLTEFPCPI